MKRPDRCLFSMWSTAHIGVILALIREHDSLPITLYLEPDNMVDSAAVAVVCDPELRSFVVGGMARVVGPQASPRYVGQCIGYAARSDPNKKDLVAALRELDAPVHGSLVPEGADLFIEIHWPAPPSDDPDPDIPF